MAFKSSEWELEYFILHDPAIERGRKEDRKDYGAKQMHQSKRYLPRERPHERLPVEDGTYHHRYGVVDNGCWNAEYEKVADACRARPEKGVRGNAERSIRESCRPRPTPPPARYSVVQDNAKKSEGKAPQEPVALGKRHDGREHGLKIRRT